VNRKQKLVGWGAWERRNIGAEGWYLCLGRRGDWSDWKRGGGEKRPNR
jgi:hypothetical protein